MSQNERSQRELAVSQYEMNGREEDFREAVQLVEDELKGNPKDAKLIHTYAYLFELHGKRELEKAERLYEESIQLAPEGEARHFNLVGVKIALGKTRETTDFYKAWVKDRPTDPEGYHYLAWAYLWSDQPQEAAKVADTALKIHPDHLGLLDAAGYAYRRTSRFDDAIRAWEHALEVDPTYVGARYGVVFVYEETGRIDDAIREWEGIISHLTERGYEIETEWPRRELKRLQEMVS